MSYDDTPALPQVCNLKLHLTSNCLQVRVTVRPYHRKYTKLHTLILHVRILPRGYQQQGRARCISAAGGRIYPGGHERGADEGIFLNVLFKLQNWPSRTTDLSGLSLLFDATCNGWRRYPWSGAAAARWGLKVGTPAGVGDATYCRRRVVPVKSHHGVIPLIATRQRLNKVPLGGRSEVTPETRSRKSFSSDVIVKYNNWQSLHFI